MFDVFFIMRFFFWDLLMIAFYDIVVSSIVQIIYPHLFFNYCIFFVILIFVLFMFVCYFLVGIYFLAPRHH